SDLSVTGPGKSWRRSCPTTTIPDSKTHLAGLASRRCFACSSSQGCTAPSALAGLMELRRSFEAFVTHHRCEPRSFPSLRSGTLRLAAESFAHFPDLGNAFDPHQLSLFDAGIVGGSPKIDLTAFQVAGHPALRKYDGVVADGQGLVHPNLPP